MAFGDESRQGSPAKLLKIVRVGGDSQYSH
jgi:hypothetical protein